ncbi:MAG TPA: hypothetical protein VK666_22210 [Chryseolinea sp.]|nr:hypothetical protein [Chryseolinea sp.]
MMKTILVTILALFSICGLTNAQESYAYFSWDINQPLSNTNWINSSSTRGAKFGFRKFIGEERRISAGLDFNWNYFREYKPTETFQSGTGATTTDYFNDIGQIALTANGQYYFPLGNKEHFFPYVGVGLGANRNNYTMSYNIYKDQETAWGFLARPEAGILVRVSSRRRLGLLAAVHYDYSTNKSVQYGYNGFSTIGFQVGAVLIQW